jgi:hypothetical protein
MWSWTGATFKEIYFFTHHSNMSKVFTEDIVSTNQYNRLVEGIRGTNTRVPAEDENELDL